jgi:hypothetical protein
MWFLTWLFMSVANASPAGSEFAGAKIGYSVPSTYVYEEDRIPRKFTDELGLKGFSALKTCGQKVETIFFFSPIQSFQEEIDIDLVNSNVRKSQINMLSQGWNLYEHKDTEFVETSKFFTEKWYKGGRIRYLELTDLHDSATIVIYETSDETCHTN